MLFPSLQPTPSTRSRQLDLWTKLLQSHCEKSNQFILTRSEPIYTNDLIKRSTSDELITELFNYMITSGVALPNTRVTQPTNPQPSSPKSSRKGQAPPPPQVIHDSVIILFIPREKWYEKLYDYAKRNGLQNGGIATAYEILNDKVFSGMDLLVLEGLMRGMMREKRNCEVMEGSAGEMEGVKFF